MGGLEVVRHEMRESTARGSALLAASTIGSVRCYITESETFVDVNSARSTVFVSCKTAEEPSTALRASGWQCAVERPRGVRHRGGVIETNRW